jgi:hypothetical protein
LFPNMPRGTVSRVFHHHRGAVHISEAFTHAAELPAAYPAACWPKN